MVRFVGRQRELNILDDVLETVAGGVGARSPGKCLMLRGRRRVGKSSLVEEFRQHSDVPSLFFTASGNNASRNQDLEGLREAVAESDLPERAFFTDDPPGDWPGALRLLADVLPDDAPSIVVLDEIPYLMDEEGGFEGTLQRAWDRQLSRKPVLLLLIGSDLSMMKALNSYERPFFQRGTEMVLGPLNPAEVADMLGLEPAAAFDAALITGGLPMICAEWPSGATAYEFLASSLSSPISALLVSAERTLAAEFPTTAMAGEVLRAISSGERTFTNIARAAGNLGHPTLNRALEVLTSKGIVSADVPLSLRPSKERRYRVTDSYLRFWLAMLEPNMEQVERMRGDLALAHIERSWTSWRVRAIEPLIRESVARLVGIGPVPEAWAVGSYWTRSNNVEIDVVGADRAPVAEELAFLGSIKWLENSPFDLRDLTSLQKHRTALTGEPVPLIAISRSGVTCNGLDGSLGPEDLLAAWRPCQ